MGALIFTAKSVVLTILLIAVLQIEWNGRSLEKRLSNFSKETGVLNIADTMAKGAIKLVKSNFDFNTVEDEKDEIVNAAQMGFNQSELYMSKKSESAKRAIEKFRRQMDDDHEYDNQKSTKVFQEDLSEDTY